MPINNIWLKTKRLIIYHPNKDHFDLYQELLRNAEVTKYIFDPKNEYDIKSDFDIVMSQYTKHGYSVSPIFKSDSLEFIGRAGFVNKTYNNKEYICLSYLLLPKFWNKGYASEAVKEIINFGFNHLNQDEILVYINVSNLASQKLLQKFNPKLIDKIEHLNMSFFRYLLTKNIKNNHL